VRERFTGTAVLTRQQAIDTGALGYIAKASGLTHDARTAHAFTELGDALTVPTRTEGDVLARFLIRAQEIQVCASLLRELLPAHPTYRAPDTPPVGGNFTSGIGIVEGWRGTITHRIEIGPTGVLTRAKIVDPSFLNWPALPLALANTIVPDFPLANKSFNLSYAGNDL
jgi:Ni,Fe-hydrogenase III large subunit